jgi:isoleucyl-tRNA synthetase
VIYRRIRNTLFKFCLANISDFNYAKDKNEDYAESDLFILNQLSENVIKINKAYETYDFMNIIKMISNHVIQLSS